MAMDELLKQMAELQALGAQQTATIAQQAATIVRLEATIAQQAARIAELEQQLADAQRRGKRQATPFSKGAPKAEPKKPGRKAGHPAAQRAKPSRIDRTLEVPLPDACPHCGGQLQEEQVLPQYQEDIPRPVQPVVTQFNVHIGHCEQCARRVQGRHPEQTSDALGAAAVQLGPNVLALGAELKHVLGVSYGKVARFCQRSFGLNANRSSFARADQRLAAQWQPSYQRLLLQLRQSKVVHVDETGWKVGEHTAWLWVFTNETLTVYQIDPSRGHAVVESILGTDFAGVLISDCFLAYDALHYLKAKCAGHLLKRCKALTESGSPVAVQFSQQLASLLRGGIKLKERQARLSPHGYRVACGKLEAALDRLLERHYRQPDTARFAKLLRKQREHLFTFLHVAEVAPTNNAAERELRPAVIIRKTNGCNRSAAGATAHSVLSSIIRTCEKQGLDFITQTCKVLQTVGSVLLDLCGSDSDPPVQPVAQGAQPALLPAPGTATAPAPASP